MRIRGFLKNGKMLLLLNFNGMYYLGFLPLIMAY